MEFVVAPRHASPSTLFTEETYTEMMPATATPNGATREFSRGLLLWRGQDYSTVRRGNSNWLIHALLDGAVAMLEAIVEAYSERSARILQFPLPTTFCLSLPYLPAVRLAPFPSCNA
jgi:hypothetical protein